MPSPRQLANLVRGRLYRWRRGESGNPSGRPRKDPEGDARRKQLSKRIPGDPEGRTYAEVAAETLARKAMNGDVAAAWDLVDGARKVRVIRVKQPGVEVGTAPSPQPERKRTAPVPPGLVERCQEPPSWPSEPAAVEPPRLNVPNPVRFIDCPKCHARMPAKDLQQHRARSCPFAPLSDQDRRALMNASTPETRQRDAWKRMVDWERFERGY